MNYQVLLNRFEEEDKRKILQVTFDGQSIFFNSCVCNRKFEADNSTFFLIGIFLHYLSILICCIIMECITNSVDSQHKESNSSLDKPPSKLSLMGLDQHLKLHHYVVDSQHKEFSSSLDIPPSKLSVMGLDQHLKMHHYVVDSQHKEFSSSLDIPPSKLSVMGLDQHLKMHHYVVESQHKESSSSLDIPPSKLSVMGLDQHLKMHHYVVTKRRISILLSRDVDDTINGVVSRDVGAD
ncbi:hypothetical protein H5410_050341 [Solanum commersonii]|uniref:Uncharacterized protein n=1 Tax=Solanum commersonii TaxID=4109 RepID=A0A9J5WV82_SOLCO|nr:hypothetical protein H5410_050341 [Solanum commersonii]